ncbi:MAG: signal peptide peptidase SppA, partial [Planctomycetes bacterium]|nr:signal peptide peptidase SppA [Planctomycetota bacterium]
ELMGKLMSPPKEPSNKLKEDSIVVLHLQGTIVDGKEASSGSIVAGPTVKLSEELTQDDKVKGVVARINSPGGSASASEGIRQAFLELAKKKPVVYSMGEVAASGGYWITCIGQPIYAEQGTITGSIGVFSMKLSVGSLLRRVGVHIESVNLDPSAALNSIDRAWTDDDISNMQRFIDDVYGKFLRYASESRKIPLEKLQSLAGGRVWSGQQAKEAGLVDEIGGVDDCLQVVAKKANLSKFKVAHKPEPSSGFDLLKMFEEGNDVDVSHAAISEIEKQWSRTLGKLGFRLEGLKAILRHSGMERPNRPLIWAMMSEEIRIK